MTSRRSGFATIFAVAVIGVVAVMLAALAAAFATDVKRSVRRAEDAQLRQLLLAGEVAARVSLASTGAPAAGDHAVKIPQEMRDNGWVLSYAPVPENQKDVTEIRVTARNAEGRSLTQTLRYVRVGDRWDARSAEL